MGLKMGSANGMGSVGMGSVRMTAYIWLAVEGLVVMAIRARFVPMYFIWFEVELFVFRVQASVVESNETFYSGLKTE